MKRQEESPEPKRPPMKRRIGNIDFFIGFEAVAAVTAALLLDKENRVAACLLAALLHEFGHVVMMRLFSCDIQSVTLGLFDVNIRADEPKSDKADFFITLGGPMMNLFCATIFFFFSKKIMAANLALGVFNLLPAESLDGGRLARIILSKKFSPLTVDRTMKISTFLFLLPLFFFGIVILLRSRYNYSLLAAALYLLAVLALKK